LSEESLETIETIAFSISDGYSYAEIAAQLGIPHKEVLVRMGKLRTEIGQLTHTDDKTTF
jgi:hypothetical protein